MDWVWQQDTRHKSVEVTGCGVSVLLHPTYSSGTTAVKGSTPLSSPFHHFWEVEMVSPVYGTDVMVGLVLGSMDLDTHRHNFCSLLGQDSHSWGFSYHGYIQHRGVQTSYGKSWQAGDTLGVHLDSWMGTVEFYLNRQPLGIAFRGLRGKELYPVISSTAAKSEMKLVTARTFSNSLQFQCVRNLAHKLPGSTLQRLLLPPGIINFIKNNYWFLLKQDPAMVPSHLLFSTTSPKRHGPRTRFVDDRLVSSIQSPGTRNLVEADSEDDDECFLITPETARKAKLVLMSKCKDNKPDTNPPVSATEADVKPSNEHCKPCDKHTKLPVKAKRAVQSKCKDKLDMKRSLSVMETDVKPLDEDELKCDDDVDADVKEEITKDSSDSESSTVPPPPIRKRFRLCVSRGSVPQ